MSFKIHNFQPHKSGDTWEGAQFTVTKNGAALDLTSATIKSEFRVKTKTGAVKLTLTEVSGITITDAANGVFKLDKQIITLPADTYHYDIEITLSNGDKKSYVEGTWEIVQDVTQ